jgi:hypothetical protein
MAVQKEVAWPDIHPPPLWPSGPFTWGQVKPHGVKWSKTCSIGSIGFCRTRPLRVVRRTTLRLSDLSPIERHVGTGQVVSVPLTARLSAARSHMGTRSSGQNAQKYARSVSCRPRPLRVVGWTTLRLSDLSPKWIHVGTGQVTWGQVVKNMFDRSIGSIGFVGRGLGAL